MEHITLAAAEVPLPPVVEEAVKRVASENVFGSLLVLSLVISGVLLWLLLRQRGSLAEQYAAREKQLLDQIDELHDKRFADMRQVLEALNGNTGALNVISQAQADRTTSSRDMGELLREVLSLARVNGDLLRAILSTVQANGQAIERLIWHGGTVRTPPSGGSA